MPDPRFFISNTPLKIDAALECAGAQRYSPSAPGVFVSRAASLREKSLDDAVVFVADAAGVARIRERSVGLCLTTPSLAAEISIDGVVGVVPDPREAFAKIASKLHAERRADDEGAGAAEISPTARVHPAGIISAGAFIGDDVEIGPCSYIGPGVVLGAQTVIGDNASVSCAVVGKNVRIASGVRIGAAGFGFARGSQGLARFPQLGRVVIGDAVEIGSNTSIDRGALDDTIIGARTKIDGLVHLGHNVQIGVDSIITAQVGIAGSTIVGDRVQIGGQAGIADHLKIGDDARIAAKAGVICDIPAGETWGGYPARPRKIWLKETALLSRLVRRRKGD